MSDRRSGRRLDPTERDYPIGLAAISSPPRLWLSGTAPTGPLVAVVGTRRPDPVGLALAASISGALAKAGYGVVAGLAPGIDRSAHRAALDAGGSTWAVIGCGLDRLGPDPEGLTARIPTAGGILSECEPGTPVTARALVARDRLQSGLSLATVVVQTDLASGTLHTARFCLLQGRPLAVVEPAATSGAGWAGNRALAQAEGCDPALLHATGAAARALADRRPMADWVLPAERAAPALLEFLSALGAAPG